MKKIVEDQLVDLVFTLKWKSRFATHTEWYLASRVNLWRDILPQDMAAALPGTLTGDQVAASLPSTHLPWQKDGPGMQARWEDTATDYFSGRPLARED
jgi:hypothetical protein